MWVVGFRLEGNLVPMGLLAPRGIYVIGAVWAATLCMHLVWPDIGHYPSPDVSPFGHSLWAPLIKHKNLIL